MSIFIPYTPTDVITYFIDLFSLDFTNLTGYQTFIITMISNLYFFIFWFIIIYFALKLFNRIWERLF